MSVIVIQFVTLDGIVSDPDGSAGTPSGGWAFRYGPGTVASRTLTDTSAWANSEVVSGDLLDAVKNERRDVIVTGSLRVVHVLMAADLVDEYRLLTFPTVLGTGRRQYPDGAAAARLECLSVERAGAAVLTLHRRAA